MVSFGEKAKIRKREILIKVVVMLLQLYWEVNLHNCTLHFLTEKHELALYNSLVWNLILFHGF